MEINLNPLIGLVVALFGVGFFQGIEIAFISANRLNIELRKKQGKRSGAILAQYIDNPATFIGANIVVTNILIIFYVLCAISFLNPIWSSIQAFGSNAYILLTINIIIVALLLLLVVFFFKALFKAYCDAIINNGLVLLIIQGVYTVFGTIAALYTSISQAFLNFALDKNFRNTKANITKVDLEQFLEQSNDHEQGDEEFDTELFENALSLSDTKIRQCLIPRKEIVAIKLDTSIAAAAALFIDTKLSKLVVYQDSIDVIVGYIHQLDLLAQPATVASILLPIPAVPESMSASDLMNKFTKERKTIAWVVDEFGGTSGIVTMEDLLEELFGEINDEYDTDELQEKQLGNNEYLLSGRSELDYLEETYNLQFEQNDSETISGYIIQAHESIPTEKERIIIGNYEFEILTVSTTRIETVKLKVLK